MRAIYAFLCLLAISFGLILAAQSSLLTTPAAVIAPNAEWLYQKATISTIKQTIPANIVPAYSNKECLANTEFITVQTDLSKGWLKKSHPGCSIQTAYGLQSATDATLQKNGQIKSGAILSGGGSKLTGYAIPRSPHFIFQAGGLYGSKLHRINNLGSSTETVVQADGTIVHKVVPDAPATTYKTPMGNDLEFADVRFSSNGKWFVGDVPFRGLTRVNVETGESISFGGAYNYAIGIRPNFVLAISADGRYVFAAERTYEIAQIYDLTACIPQAALEKFDCSQKDLLQDVRGGISDFQGIHQASFSTNLAIRLIAQYRQDSSSPFGQFLLQPEGASESKMDYLALGDSFASGEGTFTYRPYSDSRSPLNTCHLSAIAYPFLLQEQLNLNKVESVACSGARMKDILFDGPEAYATSSAQAIGKSGHDADDEIYRDFLAGYREQLDFVQQNKPNNVTVSIGGNDIGFGAIIASCIKPGTCFNNPEAKTALFNTIDSKVPALSSVYHSIKSAAASGANVYVLGYPSLAKSQGNCGLNVHLDADEIVLSNTLIEHINLTIQQAAALADVMYINTSSSFAGHRLCETNSEHIAVNGLTFGNDKTLSVNLDELDVSLDLYLTGRESYHPNQLGHRLLAQTLRQLSSDLSTAPLGTYKMPVPPAISNAPGPVVNFGVHFVKPVLLKGSSLTLSALDISNPRLLISSSLVPMRSAVSPGTYTITIPSELSTGLQDIQLHGYNQAGEPVTYQNLVYVTPSLSDIDDDGTLNTEESCLWVQASGQDADSDHVDDACDPVIKTIVPTIINPEATHSGLIRANPTIGLGADSTGQPAHLLVVRSDNTRSSPHGLSVTATVIEDQATVSVQGSSKSIATNRSATASTETWSTQLMRNASNRYIAHILILLGILVTTLYWWHKYQENRTM